VLVPSNGFVSKDNTKAAIARRTLNRYGKLFDKAPFNMCGRFTLTKPIPVLAEMFLFPETAAPQEPRFNIAPTQGVAAVRAPKGLEHRELAFLRWGLIPSWATDPSIGNRLINARAETVAEKPSFRAAFRHRRCLVLADGFYEWQRLAGKKQPYYFRIRDGQPFAFAGLWERWEDQGKPVESCTLLTTEANEVLRPVHDRMPVILEANKYNSWLDPSVQEAELLKPLLHPYPGDAMMGYPVSSLVNNPRNESPKCVDPAA
jgi:putative SOS response-associated peptidase YedK